MRQSLERCIILSSQQFIRELFQEPGKDGEMAARAMEVLIKNHWHFPSSCYHHLTAQEHLISMEVLQGMMGRDIHQGSHATALPRVTCNIFAELRILENRENKVPS